MKRNRSALVSVPFILCFIGLGSTLNLIAAELELARLFSDNAVLQREQELPVWGWTAPGNLVTVSLKGVTRTARAGEDGRWEVVLPPMKAGGPLQMIIFDEKDRILVNNILIGEVWICSGQSNMEWSVAASSNAEFEISTANWPAIRQFDVPNQVANRPQERLDSGGWQAADSAHVGSFTGVGYFFARELFKKLQIPIGMINTTWGGTIVETWTSPEAIRTIDSYRSVVGELQSLDLDAIQQKRLQEIQAIVGETLPDSDPGFKEGDPLWAMPDHDRSRWNEMVLPSLWENRGLNGLDGVIWFSKEFQLNSEQAKSNISLSLGPIDDADVTWLNGHRIGETSRYDTPRIYEIPPTLLESGTNLIVVRVTDTGGGGGIWGKEDQLFVSTARGPISLAGPWKFKVGEARIRTTVEPNSGPTLLYNAMVHPLVPFSFRGAIWYQGESNAGQAYQYRENFPLLIRDWREKWSRDFPFLWVQLANFQQTQSEPGDSTWAELREAQTMTLELANTAQAVIIDLGEADDIHPRNKQDVGYRLSLGARKVAYGEDLIHSGPVFDSMEILSNGQIRIRFLYAQNGLVTRNATEEVKGFAVSGPDRTFRWAKTRITGPDEVSITVPDEIAEPVAVRYGWADNPSDLNLYNREGLPANPFRTDDWPGVTYGVVRSFP